VEALLVSSLNFHHHFMELKVMTRCKSIALSLLAVVGLSSMGNAQNAPDPLDIYIQSMTYGGTGCPQGTVTPEMSTDRTSLTMEFQNFLASTGAGVPITESRKNCQLNINMHVPQGWTFAITTFDYKGHVELARDQAAELKSTYYYEGEVQQVDSGRTFHGPASKNYNERDRVPLSNVVWSDCGTVKPLNINAQVRIFDNGVGTPASISAETLQTKVKHTFGLRWKRC
jgi:hypothetical protein